MGDFQPFWHPVYTPVTESPKQIHTEYALNRWNPLPYEQFGAKK